MFIKKTAGPDLSGVGAVPAAPAATAPAAAGKSSGSTSRSSSINDWPLYIKNSKYGTEPERQKIKNLWDTNTPKGYGTTYQEYVRWWKATYPSGTGGDTSAVISALSTAGASGAPEVDMAMDANLVMYLSKPFPTGQLVNRDTLFGQIKALIPEMVPPPLAGGKNYIKQDDARALVTSPWKKNIVAAYNKDDTVKDGLLSVILGRTTDVPSDTGITSATGTGTDSVSQRPTSGSSIGNTMSMGGKEYYFTPRGKYLVLVQKGDPSNSLIYNSKNPSEIRQLDTRNRDFITNEERARLMILIKKEESSKAPLYESFFKGQRSANKEFNIARLLRGDQRAEGTEQMRDALTKIKSSSRQSRLDNLKKKGVI
jgi:hypothetical protein